MTTRATPLLLMSVLRRLRTTDALSRPLVGTEIRTPRLLLRPYRMTDAEQWRRIEDDESIRRGLDWPIRAERAVSDHLLARTRHNSLRIPGDLLVLAIEHSGHVIGDVSLHLRTTAQETRTVEIGWLQLRSERGQGYATEAARAMLDLAFNELRSCLVTAVIDRNNIDSIRLAQRLGFRHAGGNARRETLILSVRDWNQAVPHASATAETLCASIPAEAPGSEARPESGHFSDAPSLSDATRVPRGGGG